MRFHLFIALLAALLLAGCATSRDSAVSAAGSQQNADNPSVARQRNAAGQEGISMQQDDSAAKENAELFPGSGEFINKQVAGRKPGKPMSEDGEVTFNWEGLPVQEVVHAVLGDLLQENFVIGPGVSGEVTFSTAKPISRQQVLPVLELVLGWNNIALVHRDGMYHILPKTTAIQGNLTPRLGNLSSVKGYEVRAVPLKYISPAEMQKLLEPYARPGAILSADPSRSLIFIAGTRQELLNYQRTIDTFDVDWLAGMSVGLFPVSRVEADTIITELEAVFGAGGESPMAGMFRFMPMERLNSILVITPQSLYLERASEWIRRLDRASSEAGARLYVYRVANLQALDLAEYLNDIFRGGNNNRRRSRDGEVAPGLRPTTIDSFNQQNTSRRDQQQNRNNAERQGSGISIGDNEGISITAIEETNSLLIQASPSQYDAILAAIETLDEEPLQVHVETQVIEVVLDDQLEFGVNWFLSNKAPTAADGDPIRPLVEAGGFPLTDDGNYGQFGDEPNFFTALTRAGSNNNFLAATITALDAVTDTRVISAPSLLIRNNEEANINVGESLAVQSTSFNPNNNAGGTIASNQYIRTGIQLSVTPRVNPSGLVYLDIDQQVSSPSGSSGPNDNPNINERTLNTKVAVNSGETLVLGGLIRETNIDSESGVPGLSRIPVLGRLFGSKTQSILRTELLVLITPTVVQTSSELNRLTQEYQQKFRNIKPIRAGEDISTHSIDKR